MIATCRICLRPLTAVSDDPDLSHPSCAPADRERFEAATHGPRTYRGSMAAIHWSLCRGCGSRIEVGDTQVLADIDGRRVWACEQCAAKAPEWAPDRPESDEPALSRLPVTPAGRSERSGDDTDAPRRAVT